MSIFDKILKEDVLPDRVISLGDFGCAISHSWRQRIPTVNKRVIKGHNENTCQKQQQYFNKRLCGARVVTKNAYGILKGRWHILHKKTECRLFNIGYVIMACITLHNLCIELADPCQPR